MRIFGKIFCLVLVVVLIQIGLSSFFPGMKDHHHEETFFSSSDTPIESLSDISLTPTPLPTIIPSDVPSVMVLSPSLPSIAPASEMPITKIEIESEPPPTLSSRAELPEGFVDLHDIIPEIVVEMRYFTDDNFVGRPLQGYEANRAILTDAAANALLKVQEELSYKNMGLKIFDAYRPEMAVADIVDWTRDLEDTKMKQEYYPQMSKEDIIKKGFIAVRSAHTRGSTVDLTIIDATTLEELDMGCGFDFFGDEARFNFPNITTEQRRNRDLLREVMVRHGFHIVDRGEWWHFRLLDEPYPGTYFDFSVK